MTTDSVTFVPAPMAGTKGEIDCLIAENIRLRAAVQAARAELAAAFGHTPEPPLAPPVAEPTLTIWQRSKLRAAQVAGQQVDKLRR